MLGLARYNLFPIALDLLEHPHNRSVCKSDHRERTKMNVGFENYGNLLSIRTMLVEVALLLLANLGQENGMYEMHCRALKSEEPVS